MTAMERYINRRPGERRISVEIDEAEIADLVAGPEGSPAKISLREILADAHREFTGGES